VPHSSGSKLDLNSYAGADKQSSAQLLQYSPRILAANSSLAEHSVTESVWGYYKYPQVNAVHPAGTSNGVMKSGWKFWAEVKSKVCFTEKSSGSEFPGRKNSVDFKTRPKSMASLSEEG